MHLASLGAVTVNVVRGCKGPVYTFAVHRIHTALRSAAPAPQCVTLNGAETAVLFSQQVSDTVRGAGGTWVFAADVWVAVLHIPA